MHCHVSLEYGGLHVLAKTERCLKCGRHTGRERATFTAVDKPHYQLSLFMTSDGFFVANKKFRDFAIAHGFVGIEFVPLENGYFVLKVARRIDYDTSNTWVDQKDWCPECQTYGSNLTVPGSHPMARHEAPIAPFEIVESREKWGEECGLRTAQHPDLIVGEAARHAIKAARFRGLDIYDAPRALPV